MAHPVDLLVDLAFLLDIGVRPGHIGLGLVIVIVADKVFHGVFGKKPFEFAVELRRQCLVGCQDDRGALRGLNHLRHGECLAGACGPQQHLIALSRHHTLGQLGNGCGLIPGGFKLCLQHKTLPPFQLGARQHLGAQGGGVGVVMGHRSDSFRNARFDLFLFTDKPWYYRPRRYARGDAGRGGDGGWC